MNKLFRLFFASFILSTLPILGEVVDVTLFWDPTLCNIRCAQRLQAQLSRMREINHIDFDGEGGNAVLYWRPTQHLNPNLFRVFSNSNNLPLQQVDVRLRGVVIKTGKRYFINSLGDQTRVEIFSSAIESPKQEYAPNFTYNKRYAVEPTPPGKVTFTLSKRMADRLDDAIKTSRVVSLKGTLINPIKFPLQMLIDEQSPLE